MPYNELELIHKSIIYNLSFILWIIEIKIITNLELK